MKMLQKGKKFNKIPSEKKEGKIGDKIRYEGSAMLSHFRGFTKRVFESKRSNGYIRNYKATCLPIKEEGRENGNERVSTWE